MILANKVAFITGAGSGIGKATALLFAQEGAKVVALDIGKDARRTFEYIFVNGAETFVN